MESPITHAVTLLTEALPVSNNSCLWTC